MRPATLLRYAYLSYFSKPANQRALYRNIRRTRAVRIVEIGIGSTTQTLRMIDLASRLAEGEAVRYAAIDLFEARAAGAKLSLKEAHRLLKATSAQVQLIPGDPASALARAANSLPNVDLLLISSEHDDASLEGAWFYLPRMLHPQSVVLREVASTDPGIHALRLIDPAEIRSRAQTNRQRRAA